MKGIVYTKFGSPDVLKIKDIEKPVPEDNQVLIRVKAASMYYLDYSRFTNQVNGGKMPFSTRIMDTVMRSVGKTIGSEVAGIVESVGKNVTSMKIGDKVFGTTAGLVGGLAEYALADELTACVMPINLTFEEAATIPLASITAFGGIHDAQLKPGKSVLIYGASGGVGQSLLQQCKAHGTKVTAVCSTRNIEIAQKLGADYTIDYMKEDFTNQGKNYDFIFSVNGYNSLGAYKKLLNNGGKFIALGNSKQIATSMALGPLYSNKNKKMITSNYFSTIKQPSLPYIKKLIEQEKLKPYVENVYSAKDVKKAITNICKSHAQGKIAFKMDL